MINLAGWEGQPDIDTVVSNELRMAGIQLITGEPQRGEVPTRITGRIGRPAPYCFSSKLKLACIVLHRAWYYWVASGPVPLSTARRLYDDPVGRKDVRVSGHCMRPPPQHPWITWYDPEGHKLVLLSELDQEWLREDPTARERLDAQLKRENAIAVEDLEKVDGCMPFVNLYHIDSQEGLNLFAHTMRSLRDKEEK